MFNKNNVVTWFLLVVNVNVDFKSSGGRKHVAACLRRFSLSAAPKFICNIFISLPTHNTKHCFRRRVLIQERETERVGGKR